MSIQYPYNNSYYQNPQLQNEQYGISSQNYPNPRLNGVAQDCLGSRPPRRSPAGFKWVKIYPHFYWDGHEWNKIRVTQPYWALIDEEHPCDPHDPQQ
ncbi:hypothetical protein [Bacillus mycoides]|uniref:hypothetical protein n=1 Tax=Bacillus mycoides TaxID=1405 RepID=UPI0011A6F96F|nr:hypothetical protein [Bacillus mycoides]